ncbi:hypothetical protein [Corynebacterium guangdongense]|uniref:Membrane protein n=1 Tax=Corynebacterium guangdongense TaxID=1783348 RepID=A0ABU1ZXB0_9CORY|nr:hypothetical protein [Corynebacterium guangdongense]MDR7329571.1 putative membrane protein [Corynebacterium guangdongense]WJZ18136.1 hypothetical protein CGUA_07870 [Corynebacterium guangdongense]
MQHVSDRTLRLGSLAITAITIILLVLTYPFLPDPLPVHYSGAEPTVVHDKNLWTPIATPILALLAWLAATLLSPNSAKRLIAVDTSQASEGVALPYSHSLATRIRNRIDARSRGLAWVLLGFSVGVAYASLCAVVPAFTAGSRLTMFVLAATTFLGMLAMVRVMAAERRQTLEEVHPDEDEFARAEGLVGNQQLYRPGGSYVNPRDPMPMLTSRRDPMSFDFNYAHPAGRRFRLQLVGTFVLIAAAIVAWTIPM